MGKMFVEGSMAVALGASLSRPDVISAYPITPQTHIVEDLAKFVADGKLNCEFVNTESEFGAASVVLGAQAAGSRAYTATTSQGLILMSEVLFNVAGMRLPLVMCVANRSLSAPLSIWTDHQDIVTLRDSGFIIMFAEDAQEALDLHPIAYRIAEDKRVQLPVMINIDGFLITHTFEPVDVPDQAQVDKFLKPYVPFQALDPKKPYTMGAFTEPAYHMDVRYAMHKANLDSTTVIEEVCAQFEKDFGRKAGGLVDTYKIDDAETVLVAMGSITGLLEEAVDAMREKGKKVGVLKIKTYRPFPFEQVRKHLAGRKQVIVLDRAMSAGFGEILGGDIKTALYGQTGQPPVDSYIYGLGGRDIFIPDIEELVAKPNPGTHQSEWIGVKYDLLED
ncbi:MAG TPA: pyruvate ferredoxin oxidoreductase [Caldisericia bacterium]|nr:pyruvate ferredoxin oxidoreductase [Caldisericia bacterium]HPF49540.1 pyruvate ferredoxin oxidoreductase [Caldisericia bacterium]HPI84166.1 pyruvate ferredoxin oxidoreductase [Caldisericia bacterium]HPQ93539.1 pyruvate ferredoxin oxidoreductase [Caldisericia bacterium]HRV75455.1 pyruvate ferredoxin oxidoreductase [Caldisericia bacterium]